MSKKMVIVFVGIAVAVAWAGDPNVIVYDGFESPSLSEHKPRALAAGIT